LPTDSASEFEARPSKEEADEASDSTPNASTGNSEKEPKARRPARGTEPFEKWERDEMEKLLGELCGHLGWCQTVNLNRRMLTVPFIVLFPNRFLEGEDIANNFLFNADRHVELLTFEL
jgi:phospholipase D1/2